MTVERGGGTYRLGGADDVAWLTQGTTRGPSICSAVPPMFAAYATLANGGGDGLPERDDAIIAVLQAETPPQPWWLAFLETGGDDVVFPAAPRIPVYPVGWPYVVVEAGPDEALTWSRRSWSAHRTLPDLIFPVDRTWLFTRLWDDTWYSFGGPQLMVDAFVADPAFGAREVRIDEDMTPPGHTMM